MVKKVLLGTVAMAVIAGASQASDGFYMGAGLGKSYGNMSNKTSSRAFDEMNDEYQNYSFGDRRLKGAGFAGKLMAGYEYALTDFSLLFEAGYLVCTSKSEYDKKMLLNNTFDATLSGSPAIASMKLERNRTFSLGFGAKKGLSNKLSMTGGLDVLFSQFKYQATAKGSYTPNVGGVTRQKSKFGMAPWIGLSYDTGFFEIGPRYQYAKYQSLKLGREFSSSRFGIKSKVKPEYHTFMLTASKKF